MQPPSKLNTLVRPTADTKYHIDYSWWERNPDEKLHNYLLSHLPQEQREQFSQPNSGAIVDFIDPETGEIYQLDELSMALKQAAKAPDFINQYISVVDGIFRVFIANDNQPLSPAELEERIGRPASVILKMLSGGRVYKGIRPLES